MLSSLSAALLLNGCSTTGSKLAAQVSQTGVVATGDELLASVSCYSPEGKLIYATDPDRHGEEGKDLLFISGKTPGPLHIRAGMEPRGPRVEEFFIPFETELKYRLSMAAVGKPLGREMVLHLASDTLEDIPERERYLTVALRTRHPKQITMNPFTFEERYKEKPVPGLEITEGPFKARVESVRPDQVLLLMEVEDGTSIRAGFSQGKIRDGGDCYFLEEQVKPGQLVKIDSLGLIGQVIKVEKDTFTMDFADPFGGKELSCRVKFIPAGERDQRDGPSEQS